MIVYLLLNTINNKGYVGQHKKDSISSRWSTSLKEANFHLAFARDKYGPEAFSREILGCASTKEELDNLEKLWIITLRTYDSSYGYNMTLGGEGVQGYRHSPERIEKIKTNSKNHKGYRWSCPSPLRGKTLRELYGEEKALELIKKNSLGHTGITTSRKGKKCSAAHIEANRRSHLKHKNY